MRQFAFFLSLLFSSIALAQGANNAVVVGSVTDPNHAGVPRATITLTHVATQAVTKVTADAEGRYRTPPLRIGEYVLTVLSPGFKELRRTGVTLSIGDIREINAELLVGQVSQSVSVSDQPPLLQTSDSSVGTVITNKQIVDLPLNGRDYLQLAALSAGTVPAATTGGGISIGGQAGSQAAFLLDGLDNNNQQISTSHSSQKEIIKPSVDAIEEFKVVTNSYSAESVDRLRESSASRSNRARTRFMAQPSSFFGTKCSTQKITLPRKRLRIGAISSARLLADRYGKTTPSFLATLR
jgi:hypothetical protein